MILDGISPTRIFVSPLGSSRVSQGNSGQHIESAMIEYKRDLNLQSNLRDYLMNFIPTLPITTMNSIILQSSSLVQLTKSTNELTRNAAVLAAERCYQLSLALRSFADKVSFEDVQSASTQLAQCADNVLTVREIL